MSQETIFGIAIAVVITLFLIGKLFPKRQPKEKHFRCGRCGAFSPHTERTIEAWRNSKAKFSAKPVMPSGFNQGHPKGVSSFPLVAMPGLVQVVSASFCFFHLFQLQVTS